MTEETRTAILDAHRRGVKMRVIAQQVGETPWKVNAVINSAGGWRKKTIKDLRAAAPLWKAIKHG